MEKIKSIGITVFGAIFIIWAIVVVLWMILDYLVMLSYGMNPFSIIRYAATFLYIFLLITTGVGLLQLKTWARKIILFFWVPFFMIIIPYRQFVILNSLSSAAIKITVAKYLEFLRIGYAILLLIYFTHAKAREQFK